MSRWRMVAAAAMMVCGLTALTSGSSPTGSTVGQSVLTGNSLPGEQDFIIYGAPFPKLYPGAVRRIKIRFRNPNPFRLQVNSVGAYLKRTSKRGCRVATSNLEIRSYRGTTPLILPPNGRRAGGYIELYMPNSVSPACQNATFSIKLTGKAVRAPR